MSISSTIGAGKLGCGWRWRLGLTVAVLWAGGVLAAEVRFEDLPVRSSRHPLAGMEAQRARYNNDALIQKAYASMTAGDTAAARKLLEEVLSIDPGNNRARVFLVQCMDRLGDAAGIRVCDSLLQDYPEYLQMYLYKGYMALKADLNSVAIEAFDGLQQRVPPDDPRFEEALKTLAPLYIKTGDYAKAETSAAQAVKRQDAYGLRMILAQCAEKRAAPDDVLANLAAAELLASSDAERCDVWLWRIALRIRLGQTGELDADLRNFDALLDRKFDEKQALHYLETLKTLGRNEAGLAAAEKHLQQSGTGVEFRKSALGYALHFNRALDRKAQAYETAKTLHALSGTPASLLEVAYAADAVNATNEAAAAYGQYLEGNFDPAVALNCQFMLRRAGNPQAGEPVLTRALASTNATPLVRQALVYELARIYRETGRDREYRDIMAKFADKLDDARLRREFADYLYGQGDLRSAADLFEQDLKTETEPAKVYAQSLSLAEIYLGMNQTGQARQWMDRAEKAQPTDRKWEFTMARIDYKDDKFRQAADRLMRFPVREPMETLYMAYSLNRSEMRGLALHYLNTVTNPVSLPRDQQQSFYENRAYLYFDQEDYSNALSDAETALQAQPSSAMMNVRLSSMARLGRYKEVRKEVEDILTHTNAPVTASAVQAEVDAAQVWMGDYTNLNLRAKLYELSGLCSSRLGEPERAIEAYTRCLETDTNRVDVLYPRGLEFQRMGNLEQAEKDFLAYQARVPAVAEVFFGDFAIVEGALGNYEDGTKALEHTIRTYSADLDSREEAGYQYMKDCRNPPARDCFGDAIDLYTVLLPYLSGVEHEEYRNNRRAMKQEYSKLDRTLGGQVYVNRTDYGLGTGSKFAALDGALPSQAGAELSFRPPKLGFRNERTLDGFVRGLANFEQNSWTPDSDSYQGGVGLRWKPFIKLNANTTFERLFKIGSNSEDNWLWRVLASQEWGEKPHEGRTITGAGKIYGEAGDYLLDRKRWYYYLDGRLGLALFPRDHVILTIPEAMGVIRHENPDVSGLSSYSLLGIGLNARFLEGEKRYTLERWYLELHAHYMWGWFENTPGSLERRDFEGVMVGVNFVK